MTTRNVKKDVLASRQGIYEQDNYSDSSLLRPLVLTYPKITSARKRQIAIASRMRKKVRLTLPEWMVKVLRIEHCFVIFSILLFIT